MFLESSAYISQLIAGTKDKLGITYYPHADGQKANGVAIGGASLWIEKNQPKNVQEGAWQFIKYLSNAENQAKWQKATGYMAINKNSNRTSTLKNLYKKQPEAQVPTEQLKRTIPNYSNSGLFFEGVLKERILSQTAMQQIKDDSNINSSLKTAEDSMNDYITQNNKANKK
ncbi:hypothetical protein WR164_15760 [Philodulcilactobacillus myokoensis]|uniref:Extracellular solute-binding protein n=2 Tax=Philodulcilactobacillus myokoensis TaxID=2929573 RepID=A0A9W6B276_9LACO|nr:hypothetical protein WR164_15760 [Philodulcilactobacillus myokoensis]